MPGSRQPAVDPDQNGRAPQRQRVLRCHIAEGARRDRTFGVRPSISAPVGGHRCRRAAGCGAPMPLDRWTAGRQARGRSQRLRRSGHSALDIPIVDSRQPHRLRSRCAHAFGPTPVGPRGGKGPPLAELRARPCGAFRRGRRRSCSRSSARHASGEGLSGPGLARRFKIHRQTVREALVSPCPGPGLGCIHRHPRRALDSGARQARRRSGARALIEVLLPSARLSPAWTTDLANTPAQFTAQLIVRVSSNTGIRRVVLAA